MTDCNEHADYEWLTGDEAAALIGEVSSSDLPLHRQIDQLRRRLPPARAHLVIELVELRLRAAEKFAAAERMFFTRVGLEQATDEWTAAYKASRFKAAGRVADLCCGIGGDLLALVARGPVIGVDRDPIATHFAAANAPAVLSPSDAAHVDLSTTDVEAFDLANVAAWHIDPDRRPGGRRTTSLEWSEPNLSTLERMLTDNPHGAIKLAPAAQVPADWAARCELEWLSSGGECRQLVAWHGDLAQSPGKRRATIIANAAHGPPPRTVIGEPNRSIPIAAAPDRYIFDIDSAILAAHLKGALAAEHGLSALAAGPTYLTGPTATNDAALDCFEVTDAMSPRVATLAPYLHARGIGRLEIKKRGVDLDPEKLRRSLKIRGDNAATLLITPIAGRPVAILALRRLRG